MPPPYPTPQSHSNPAPRVGYGQHRLRAATDAQRRADDIQETLTLRFRENEARKRQDQETESLVENVREARQAVENALTGLQRAADTLRTHARRSPDEAAANYMIYANAHIRLTGALANGVRRTASMEKVLNSADARREDARRREEEDRLRRELRDHERQVHELTLPQPDRDAFDEVYGELTNAE